MSKRNYVTEYALSLYSAGVIQLRPKDTNDIDLQAPDVVALAERCHIYLIVTRPRCMFVPESIVVSDHSISGRMFYSVRGERHEFTFAEANSLRVRSARSDTYPYGTITFVRDDQTEVSLAAHVFTAALTGEGSDCARNLEVQYVGMSYAQGNRSAKDRLQSHSTLQRVLADLNSDSPDDEVLLLLYEYCAPQIILTMDGFDKSLDPDHDRDVVGDLERQKLAITEEIQISLIEAGLIKYFEPRYNSKYKEFFPSRRHKILDEVYDIDICGLVVEINSEELNARLFSGRRPLGMHHVACFDLHDVSVRRSFFNMWNDASGSDADNMTGPAK